MSDHDGLLLQQPSTHPRRSDSIQSLRRFLEAEASGALAMLEPVDDRPRPSTDEPRNMGNSPSQISAVSSVAESEHPAQDSLDSSMRSGTQVRSRGLAFAATIVGTLIVASAAKGIASGMHLGLTRNHMLEQTRDWGDADGLQGVAGFIGSQALVALVAAAAHYLGEMVLKPAITEGVGLSIKPRDPNDIFPEDRAVIEGGESNASKRTRMKGAQSLGKVNSLTGNLAGLLSFGAMQGVRGEAGFTSANSAGWASASGGAGMEFLHSTINLLTSVDGEATHEIDISDKSLQSRLKAGIADAMPKKKVDGTEESTRDVLLRISHDILVGRAVPLFQGGLAQAGLMAVMEKNGVASEFGAGMVSPLALLGLAFFTMHSEMKGRWNTTEKPLQGSRHNVTNWPPQLQSLVPPDSPNTKIAMQGLDGLNTLVSLLERAPAHLVLDAGAALGRSLAAARTAPLDDEEQQRPQA
ncbi:hypothetical protein [Variovorax sp. 770b2]|uniref:hypothetical protein n=1 Tax=Variovorax sp. 770b2 TaxID=1566271 RepID=UPI0015A4F03B|nr:hypothetical protein [Variovorax sp. 770b2]